VAGGKRRAQDGGEFATAEGCCGFQRIRDDRAVALQSGLDGRYLAAEPGIVHAGPASSPALHIAAEEGCGYGRGRCRVADAHLAEADQIKVFVHGVVAGRDGGEKCSLVHGGFLREVAGRLVEVERDDVQLGIRHAGKLVDRRAAIGEVRHHLNRHFRRIGGNALRGHAVIAGEDDDLDPVELRHVATLPTGQPAGDVLKPAEASARLGEYLLMLCRHASRFLVAGRQGEAGGAQFFERFEGHVAEGSENDSGKGGAGNQKHGDFAELLQRAGGIARLPANLTAAERGKAEKQGNEQDDGENGGAGAEG
jgi:hypothetical protein